MKKLAYLFLGLIMLSGCARGQLEVLSEEIKTLYTENEKLTMTAMVRTDYGDRVIDFEVDCSRSEPNKMSMEVVSPDIIKGVTATTGESGVGLEYDGMILELGALPQTGLSPLETLPYMTKQWSDGYQTSAGLETISGTQCVRLTYKNNLSGVSVEQHVWFDKTTLKPVISELYSDGVMTVRCTYTDVTLGG